MSAHFDSVVVDMHATHVIRRGRVSKTPSQKATAGRQGATAWAAVDFKTDGWEAVIPWIFGGLETGVP
jgi:hypothetical protein